MRLKPTDDEHFVRVFTLDSYADRARIIHQYHFLAIEKSSELKGELFELLVTSRAAVDAKT